MLMRARVPSGLMRGTLLRADEGHSLLSAHEGALAHQNKDNALLRLQVLHDLKCVPAR